MCPEGRALREAMNCFGRGVCRAAWCRCHVKWFSQPLACPRAMPGYRVNYADMALVLVQPEVCWWRQTSNYSNRMGVIMGNSGAVGEQCRGSQQSQGMLQEGLLEGCFKQWSEGWSAERTHVKIWWWGSKTAPSGNSWTSVTSVCRDWWNIMGQGGL